MSAYAIGIDVGGTKIAAGVVDSDGKILARFYSRAHTGHPPALVIDGIEEAFHAVLAQWAGSRDQVQGVGIGCAGHVNGMAGKVLTSSNLPEWENVPLRDLVAQRVGMSVALDNDAKCAALGEYRFGAGRGSRHMCYVTFSTGYGMGLVIDGKLYRGAIGTAGEIGHTVIVPDGERCPCGKERWAPIIRNWPRRWKGTPRFCANSKTTPKRRRCRYAPREYGCTGLCGPSGQRCGWTTGRGGSTGLQLGLGSRSLRFCSKFQAVATISRSPECRGFQFRVRRSLEESATSSGGSPSRRGPIV